MRYDVLLDNTGNLDFHNGDFGIGQSDQQHVEHILEAQKGEYKEFPLVGFGIINYLKKSERIQSDFKRDLKIQLEHDGYQNPNIDLSQGFTFKNRSMKTIILHNQSLLDLAIQHTGSVENAFTIAVANGLSLTDELEAGGESGIPKVQENKDILGYYQAKRLQPATAIQHQEARVEKLEGIDYWAISTDFIIS